MTVSPPTIRDEILAAWRSILVRAGARQDSVDALVLELEVACEGRTVRLPRRQRLDDPNAAALAPPPAPGDAAAGLEAARAALRPYGGVDRRADHDHITELPDIPKEPECPNP